uniref:OB domain-containing protein n=1 Tax=Aegilops tauschii subsp. strangulata TaxID=200361 RepID=A0A453K507_AEGTS
MKQIIVVPLSDTGEKGDSRQDSQGECPLYTAPRLCVHRDWLLTLLSRLGGLLARLIGMVTGKMERNTDVSFTLDNDTGCINFIRC